MPRQEINIGQVGNDGTGDSIRESFRKTNENFRELYSVFGQGDQISFLDLSDTPDTYIGNNQKILMANAVDQRIDFKSLQGGTGISIDTSNPNTVTITNTTPTLNTDLSPTLGNHLNAGGFLIGNLRSPDNEAVADFGDVYGVVPFDSFAVTVGFGDARYVNRTGDNMLSTLLLHDHPLPYSNTNPAPGFYLDPQEEAFAKQAATKYYVDIRDQEVYTFIDTNLGAASDVQFNSLAVTDLLSTTQLSLENNIVSSTTTNGDIILSPNGTGKVIISGDLQVDGTSTTINSTILEIDDINIILAKGAANAAAANGGGITLEGPTTPAQITYASSDDSWNTNKKTSVPELQVDNINVNGNTISSTDSNGNIVLSPNGSGTVDVSNSKIVNLTDPSSAQDAATRNYVDNAIEDGILTVEGGYGLSGTGTFTANQSTSSTITLDLDNTVVKNNVTINAFAYYELTPSTEFGVTVAVDEVVTIVRMLDDNPASPTYNMKINAESIVVIAYTGTTIRVYNDSSSNEVFDIVLKL